MPKTKAPITGRQSRFIHEYLINSDATKAARLAGYSERTASSIGHELLNKPAIAEAIAKIRDRALERSEATVQRIIAEFVVVALLDPAEMFHPKGDTLRSIHEMPQSARRALTGFEVEELFEGRGEERRQVGVIKKVKFAQKTQALEALGKHLKMFVDGQTTLNQTVIFNQVNELVDEQASRRGFEAMMSRLVGRQVTIDEAVAAVRQVQPAAFGKPALRLVGPDRDGPEPV